MFIITNDQLFAITELQRGEFCRSLARIIRSQFKKYQDTSEEKLLEIIRRDVNRGREFGFSERHELVAFVIAFEAVGEERLVLAPAFGVAAFNVSLETERRAALLTEAREQAERAERGK